MDKTKMIGCTNYLEYIDDHIKNVNKCGKFLYDNNIIPDEVKPYIEMENGVIFPYHDHSKYLDDEFEPYRLKYYKSEEDLGEYTDEEIEDIVNKAIQHHYDNNAHHWNHWIIDGRPVEMLANDVYEMIADWMAMSLHFGTSLVKWYKDQLKDNKIILHEKTKELVESIVLYTLPQYGIK